MCEFKLDEAQVPLIYSPEEIRCFRIDNSKYYFSKEIEVDSAKLRVFLEYLVDGIVDLYYLKTPVRSYYFIEKDNVMTLLSNETTMVELTEKEHTADQTAKMYLKNSNRYKQIMRYLFQDSPITLSKLQNTSFAYKPLINIAVEYHNDVCKDQECINFTRQTKSGIWFEPYLGLVNSKMRLKTSEDVASDLMPFGGFKLRFQPLKGFSMWNVAAGLNYSENSFSGDFTNRLYRQVIPNDRLARIYSEYTILRIPISLERSFTQNRLQPFVSAGYSNGILMKADYEVMDIELYSSEVDTYFRTYQYGLTTGAGFRYHTRKDTYLWFKGEYEYRRSLTDSGWILDKQWVNSIMITAGYGFRIK